MHLGHFQHSIGGMMYLTYVLKMTSPFPKTVLTISKSSQRYQCRQNYRRLQWNNTGRRLLSKFVGTYCFNSLIYQEGKGDKKAFTVHII